MEMSERERKSNVLIELVNACKTEDDIANMLKHVKAIKEFWTRR